MVGSADLSIVPVATDCVNARRRLGVYATNSSRRRRLGRAAFSLSAGPPNAPDTIAGIWRPGPHSNGDCGHRAMRGLADGGSRRPNRLDLPITLDLWHRHPNRDRPRARRLRISARRA